MIAERFGGGGGPCLENGDDEGDEWGWRVLVLGSVGLVDERRKAKVGVEMERYRDAMDAPLKASLPGVCSLGR